MYKGYPGIYILKIGESTKNPIAMINTYPTETNAVRQALSVINFSRSSSRETIVDTSDMKGRYISSSVSYKKLLLQYL